MTRAVCEENRPAPGDEVQRNSTAKGDLLDSRGY